jgi:hypothetical protein
VTEQKTSAKSKKAKRVTVSQLLGKSPRTREVEIPLGGDTLSWKFQAIPANELDALQAKHPPTKEQRARNLGFNPNTFAPELVAACSIDPQLSKEEARDIWNSEQWSTGELNFIFDVCTSVCMEGFNVPFTESD